MTVECPQIEDLRAVDAHDLDPLPFRKSDCLPVTCRNNVKIIGWRADHLLCPINPARKWLRLRHQFRGDRRTVSDRLSWTIARESLGTKNGKASGRHCRGGHAT